MRANGLKDTGPMNTRITDLERKCPGEEAQPSQSADFRITFLQNTKKFKVTGGGGKQQVGVPGERGGEV